MLLLLLLLMLLLGSTRPTLGPRVPHMLLENCTQKLRGQNEEPKIEIDLPSTKLSLHFNSYLDACKCNFTFSYPAAAPQFACKLENF